MNATIANKGLPFEEIQRFRQSWIIYIVLFADFITLGFVWLTIAQEGVTSTDALVAPWIILPVPLLVTALLWIANLRTTVDRTGITLQFFPFHRKSKVLPWADIATATTGSYTLMQTGGYGIRKIKGGWGYNVSGSDGIWVDMKNGTRYLIGTQQPAAMQAALEQAMPKPLLHE